MFDDDGSGKITFRKLRRVARELGETLTDEEIQEMIDEADRNGDGQIYEEVIFSFFLFLWDVLLSFKIHKSGACRMYSFQKHSMRKALLSCVYRPIPLYHHAL